MTLEPAPRAAASQTTAVSPVSPRQPPGVGMMRAHNWNQTHSLGLTAEGRMGSWFFLVSPHSDEV